MGIIVGSALGSFISATSYRLIAGESLKGRSYCEHCRHNLRVADLIPIVSFLYLRGRCRYCSQKIRTENFLIELVMAGIGALVFGADLPVSGLLFVLFVITVLGLVFLIDLKTGYILDKITYPAIVGAVLFRLFQGAFFGWEQLLSAVGAGLGGAAFFALLIIVTRGKGMGWGDVKLVLFLGLVLGFPKLLVGLFLAFLIGSVVALGLILGGKKSFGQTVPFGPFLSLGSLIALLWGERLLSWYLTAV